MTKLHLDLTDIDAKFWATVKLENKLYKQTQNKLEDKQKQSASSLGQDNE